MSSKSDNRNLEPLLIALVEDRLSDSQIQELRHVLRGDPHARQRYADYMTMHAMLRWEHADMDIPIAPESLEPTELPPVHAPKAVRPASVVDRFESAIDWRRHKLRFGLFVMAVVLLLWTGVLQWLGNTNNRVDPGDNRGALVFVADVAGLHEAVWADKNHAFAEWRQLMMGDRLELKSGIVEIAFRDGARVLLQGPATFVIGSRGSGTLEQGRLTARVAPEAAGFTISTPTLNVIDLGTEFGIQIDDEKESTNVHVFVGTVDVYSRSHADSTAPRRRLVAGQAATFSPQASTGILIAAQPRKFLRIRRVPKGQHGAIVWQSYSDSFGENEIDRYVGSQSYSKGGTFEISEGRLNLSPSPGNTTAVMLSDGEHGLGVEMRVVIDTIGFDPQSRDAVFLMVSSSDAQPDGQTSFGVRLRRDSMSGAICRVQTIGLGDEKGLMGTKVQDPGGTLRLIIERPSPTTLTSYYQQPGGKVVLIGTSEIPELAAYSRLYVGVQAWSMKPKQTFAFDDFEIEGMK